MLLHQSHKVTRVEKVDINVVNAIKFFSFWVLVVQIKMPGGNLTIRTSDCEIRRLGVITLLSSVCFMKLSMVHRKVVLAVPESVALIVSSLGLISQS